ncbi:cytochrome P450 [Aspergillus aurantiobrunneus]
MLATLLPWSVVTFGLYISIVAIWYVFLHPLRRIPGPKLWITFPVLRYISVVNGTFDGNMRAFHGRYGPVVRYSRDEVSFTTAEAWQDICGHGHRLPKVLSSTANKFDIIAANDENHSRYRKALSHAFSAKGLQGQEPLLNSHVDKLIERLNGVAESGLPADMVKWYNLTTFDILGDLAFGEPFGGLDSSEYHHWVAFIKLKDAYPVVFQFFQALLPRAIIEARKEQVIHPRMTVQKRLQNASAYNRGDFMDSMLRHRGEKDGLTNLELEANSNILIIAGSETTATLLSGATYWLLRTSDVLAKLTSEVRSVMKTEGDITFQKVTADLPYMLACFNEAFRLYPPVPTGLQRRIIDPANISGYDIPPGTKVSVHQLATYHSPSNFHRADCFIPERWFPETKSDPTSLFFSDNREAVQAFSVGPRNCIGRKLAFAEMRVILARVLWSFDLELCEESASWNDQKTYPLWEKPPLMCTLRRRETAV